MRSRRTPYWNGRKNSRLPLSLSLWFGPWHCAGEPRLLRNVRFRGRFFRIIFLFVSHIFQLFLRRRSLVKQNSLAGAFFFFFLQLRSRWGFRFGVGLHFTGVRDRGTNKKKRAMRWKQNCYFVRFRRYIPFRRSYLILYDELKHVAVFRLILARQATHVRSSRAHGYLCARVVHSSYLRWEDGALRRQRPV